MTWRDCDATWQQASVCKLLHVVDLLQYGRRLKIVDNTSHCMDDAPENFRAHVEVMDVWKWEDMLALGQHVMHPMEIEAVSDHA
jgi:hypothetical protein